MAGAVRVKVDPSAKATGSSVEYGLLLWSGTVTGESLPPMRVSVPALTKSGAVN